MDARAGRRRGALGRILCGRGRGNGAILADLFARDAHRTPPNKCAGLALTHRIGASVVGGLWIHADQGGRTNARSRDAATVQEVVVVIPCFKARLAAHSDCADEQNEGCQGTPRARHGNVPRCDRCNGSSQVWVTRLREGKSTTREKNGELPLGSPTPYVHVHVHSPTPYSQVVSQLFRGPTPRSPPMALAMPHTRTVRLRRQPPARAPFQRGRFSPARVAGRSLAGRAPCVAAVG